jgi:beta-lactamase regulating signal transducer with metallopeptidase domain
MIAGALPDLAFVNTWIVAMGRASLEGAVAIGLAWLVCRIFPRLPAGVRCWLWRLALLKMVLAVVPLGSIDLPFWPQAWMNQERAGDCSNSSLGENGTVPFADSPTVVRGGDGVAAEPSNADRLSASSTQPAVFKGSSVGVGSIALFAAWLLALAVFVGVVVVRVRGARRWRQQWQLIKDRDILTLGERLAAEYRLFQPPVLFEAENCESPVVFGAVRTVIVLPSALVAHSTANQLRLVLAHEMAHIRRGDLLGNWFSTLVWGLFFFHPLVWLALRESRLLQEVACDELAVRRPGVSVADYGRLLVELATQRPMPASPLVTVGVVESFHVFLKRRLSAMKNFGTRSWKVFALSWFVAIVAALGLLPWRLVAQTESDEVAAEKALKAVNEQVMKVDSKSGPYKVTVDRVRREAGRKITMVESGFPPFFGNGGNGNSNGTQHSETKTFPGGQAAASGAAMGGGGGMAGGSGGVFHVPNLILDVVVTGPKMDKKHQLLCTVHGAVKAVDDQGRAADSPPDNWMRTELLGVEYKRGPGRMAIHLALAPGDPPARYLKSVDGELLVAEGIVNQMTFRSDELSHPAKKTVGGVSVHLEKVSQSTDGIDVTLGALPAKANNVNPMNNPMEHMQRRMLANAPGRVKLVIEDSDGEMHAVKNTSQHISGSNGGSSFESGSSSGSGSFGGGSSGGSSGGSGGGPNGKQGGSISSGGSPGQGTVYHFDPLPEGVSIKAIHCRVTDFVDAPKAIPFHLENIQLPNSLK